MANHISLDGQAIIRRAHRGALCVTKSETRRAVNKRANTKRREQANAAARTFYQATVAPALSKPEQRVDPAIQKRREKCRRWAASPQGKAYKNENRERLNAAARAGYSERRRRQAEIIAGRPIPDACEVCGTEGKVCIDHCHESVLFRGFICSSCNLILGHAKDDPERLRKLADYLERSNA